MNSAEKTLLENIDNPKAIFVFPTDVAASGWADRVLMLKGGALAMNRFIAWDTFKQNSIRSKVQDKKAIPSALRKIFVCRLILENERQSSSGLPVFISLIPPAASQFADWLSGMLPQLGAWFAGVSGMGTGQIQSPQAASFAEKLTGDERDLFTLALRYAHFLEENGLFEPAWETPPFDDAGKDFFIFFPDSLSDYDEYGGLLEKSGRVKTVNASAGVSECDTFFYSNSRGEIAEAALYIRSLHEREGIPWDSIAVCLPDSENYEPYVLREFDNRNIPYARRTGKPLASYRAGRFFRAAGECVSGDFSFSAVTSLLLNSSIPWKDKEAIGKLIDFGIRNNCVAGWTEETDGKKKNINVWEDAFAQPFGGIGNGVKEFFRELKRRAGLMCGASTFAELRRQYFIFREKFFDMKNCLPETDLVLSRCISELTYLTEIEKSFSSGTPPNPYAFFTGHLEETLYLAQQSSSGVAILPYRTAASAPFECHIILGASQDSLSSVFTRLAFLPRTKREKLNIADRDASAAFIRMHMHNSFKGAAFFCSEQTFNGYAIPHSRLDAQAKSRAGYREDPAFRDKFSQDLYAAEGAFFSEAGSLNPLPEDYSEGGKSEHFRMLHETQKKGFEQWRRRRFSAAPYTGNRWYNLGTVRDRLTRNPYSPGKFIVSATSLRDYFQCPFLWLFHRALNLENVSIQAGLMPDYISGTVYHEVLNLFFNTIKENNEILFGPEYEGSNAKVPAAYRALLADCVEKIFAGFPRFVSENASKNLPQMSALTARLLSGIKNEFHYQLENCIAEFLSIFKGYSITGTELGYSKTEDNFCYYGVLDCVLEDSRKDSKNSGKLTIVDFKLWHPPARSECVCEEGELENFQLPMYTMLAEENENREVAAALFFSILTREKSVIFGAVSDGNNIYPKKQGDRIERAGEQYKIIMGEFTEKARRFAKEIESCEFSFSAGTETCVSCDYRRVCRTVYKISR